MKKSVKRIACGVLSVMMASALVTEHVLRVGKETTQASAGSATTAANTSFTDVTGQFDTSKMVADNFNSSVLEADKLAPKYETRTVMITLSGKPIADRAGEESVQDYIGSWSGDRARAELAAEQQSFLKALDKTGIAYKLESSYDVLLNGVAIEVDTKYVSQIKQMSGVESVVITTAYSEPKTAEAESTSSVVTNETDVYATGIYDSSEYAATYGEGTVVAVLDTGLDYTHNAFQRFASDNVDVAWSEADVAKTLADYQLEAEKRSGSLNVTDVYVSEKVPFAYDYADDDPDVYPSYSNHGTHVAGIIGGYDTTGYTDKDGNPINETFKGVVPDCQLVICKVFTDDLDDKDLGGAVAEDIVAALEDCVTLGVDVINMSLGTSCGFSTTDDGDSEGEMLNAVYERIQKSGISLICAASNDYSAGYGGVYGTNLASNPDSGTVGSPSTFAGALSVASINGQKADYMIANAGSANEAYVFYEESRDIDGNPFDFRGDLLKQYDKKEFEYVVVPGVGHASDYTAAIKRLFVNNGKNLGRIALVKRGDTTFEEKVRIAMEMGAIGVIVYNNVSGVIRMNLGEIENPVPAVSVTMNAGNALANGAVGRVGTIKIDETYAAGPFMSEFSSWGPTHDLKLKPEITAHGGEITSTVPGGYGEQSGTSMATPNMAGFMALVRSYVKNDLGVTDSVELNRLAMQLTMSTAGTVYDQDGYPYSPRKQGAGVAKLENVIGGTSAYLWTDSAANDYRPKIECGDDKDKDGEYVLNFNVTNFGANALSFETEHLAMTETLSSDRLTVAEQAHMLNKASADWSVTGDATLENGVLTVAKNGTASVTVVLRLTTEEKAYIDDSFANGMYVEGFLRLLSKDAAQCDLSIPFLAFYGDWTAAPMLDYSAFEVAANAQDASVKDEDKIQASVWETLPYTSYYDEKYILPMGGYVYLLAEGDDKMYVDEEHCSVSRYSDYNDLSLEGDDYMTSTAIKAVYAGLLRNARVVKYSLYNEETGETIFADKVLYRIGKAYSGGGSGVPANVEVELDPLEEGLVANGKYRMNFEFFQDEPKEGQRARAEDTYTFSFTVDYDAPVLEDVRIRYYNYKDGDKQKQRIYLDVDIYDNHYPQALMLCYPTTESLTQEGENQTTGQTLLQLATEYPIPVRNAKKNTTNTVSIEITDIYEEYLAANRPIYLQVDDYALNSCLYQLDINKANAGVLPDKDGFELAAGENKLTLDIYETHKVSLVLGENYVGSADASNFNWSTSNPLVARVKNGEIVGLKKGTATITVDNRKGSRRTISVTVTEDVESTLPSVPSISFGIIETDTYALKKANGVVEVNPGKAFTLSIQTDPWYHPMTDLRVVWETTNDKVATVDQDGNVRTLKKGMASISAKLEKLNAKGVWEPTLYTASVMLRVEDEFNVSNSTLIDYNGWGGEVVIPTDMNIWYIGEDAFKDNNNITKIVIPSSVIDIREGAFTNCTALEEVYFVSEEHRVDERGNINAEIDWSDLSMIYEEAFMGCTKLRKIDFSNVKTATVARDCFSGCTSLTEVVDMPSIGTMHHRAFAGTALRSADLTGLHMSGESVFAGCTQLTSITTGKFTAMGKDMFKGCTGLTGTVTIHTARVGESAFSGCTNLSGVKFESLAGEALRFEIGANAFENCGTSVGGFTVDFGAETIRTIGYRAFAGSALKTLDFSKVLGVEALGADIFANTGVAEIVLGDGVDLEKMQLDGASFIGKTVKVAENSEKYVYENGAIYNQSKTKLLFVNESVTGAFTLPETVREISAYAFANSKITSITLHANVTKLGAYAFYCSSLASIDFADAAITELAEGAFSGSKLSSIVLPNTVTKLGASAFEDTPLTSFVGDGVKSIGDRAFANCATLQTIALPDGAATMGSEVFSHCRSLKTVTLPSVTSLGRATFGYATALEKVTFGADATTTGEYTFIDSPVKEVVFQGNAIEKISDYAFYNARNLQTITLPDSVKEIGAYAFYNASAIKSLDLKAVEKLGAGAFYNNGLTTIALDSAEYIGDFAFGVENNGGIGASTSISFPVAIEIGAYAFLNTSASTVTLPASLQKLGAGVFGSAANLATVQVENGNKHFFVEENVVYRNLLSNDGGYELVFYPSALADADKAYTLKEGTVRVEAYAFYDLNAGALEKVTLPYSVKAIGDSAFFASGVKEYTFESIQAPALETVWRQEIQQTLQSLNSATPYRGYYYANFETYIFNYTQFGSETSSLVMNYPSNGKGYDNHIYMLYFGERKDMGALMEDNTREAIRLIDEMYQAMQSEKWSEWTVTDENKLLVTARAETVRTARVYYNNATANETQAKFITDEITEKLTAVEETLRVVKKKFGIETKVYEIRVAAESTHKTQYNVGETFDLTGLVITVVYDDYSTETADPSEITLITGKLTQYSNYAEVSCRGKRVRIGVTMIKEETPTPGDSGSDSTRTE